MKVAAILPAAGLGIRLGKKKPKALVRILGKPLLYYTLKHLSEAYDFHEIIIAVEPTHLKAFEGLIKKYRLKRTKLVTGGASRAESVQRALSAVSRDTDWVLVHDAARPLVSRRVVESVLQAARLTGAAIASLPITSTVKKMDETSRRIIATEDRSQLCLAQTPQVFRKRDLIRAYDELGVRSVAMTDEAALFDGTPIQVMTAAGEACNLKVTLPEDIELFKYYLSRRQDKKG